MLNNIISNAADLHDVYAIVLHAAQQSNAAAKKQIIAALLQFSNTGDVYALHTALSKITTYTGDALQNALANVSDYVSVV